MNSEIYDLRNNDEDKNDEEKNVKEKKGDKWGLAVCFGTVITFVAGIGHVNSFGLIYNDFIKNTDSTAKSFTTAHGIFSLMLAAGGIILHMMSGRFSLRFCGIIGASIMVVGSFSTVFITNTNHLSVTFGVLQGIGFGMMVPVCYSTLNYYFVDKRTTVMSICKALQGIILMWYPILLKSLMDVYTFRGTLLIISGLALHTVPGMLIMKTDFKKKPRKIHPANNLENGEVKTENVDLLGETENNRTVVDTDCSSSPKRSENKVRRELLRILNFKMLKDPIYCNICIGQSFVNFSDVMFFVLLPFLMFEYVYDAGHVVICIAVCGISDLAGRCALAVISYFVPMNTRVVYYVATLLTFLTRLVMLQVERFSYMVAVTIVLGLLRAWLHVCSPLVISNHVSHQDFPGAYALFMLATGLVNFTFSPLIGLLIDTYMEITQAFYAFALCCVPCLVLWPIEYFMKKRSHE